MLLNKFERWQLAVKEMNDKSDELSQHRDECYSWMADKIKDSFKKANLPVPSIHFEDDASEIVCSWDANNDLIVPVTLILDLHMSFSWNKRLNTDGLWRKTITFYPLMDNPD